MLRRAALVATLTLGLLGFGLGCAGYMRAPVQPPSAGVFTNVSAPLDHDMEETRISRKRGTSSAHNILGLVAWGDASIRAAARDGEIETVHQADYDFLNVLGIYSRFTTVATGE